ncbi:MAG: NAD(P)/FAD-dependent oxidoreductase [Myxococcota bacterium]|nr:NAD(P)/FAD-dependent oxidoreductase [Myxococcota bacterium]
MNETATDVLVIGAGPAGLAVGGCLKPAGVAFELLERASKVAPRWRDHYERLHLHTFRDLSRLPDHPWPLGVAAYPSRDQVVAYFEEHARQNGLRPRFEREVTSLRREGTRWVARTRGPHGDERWSAPRAVVATGYNRVPNRPRWPGEETFSGRVMHAAEYRNGREWLGKRALVVGSGNSGAEIVLDLFEHGASTSMCVRHPTHVSPRDLFGVIPTQVLGLGLGWLPPKLFDRLALPMTKRLVGDLSAYGISRPERGPMELLQATGRVPLLDIGTVELIRQGRVTVYPGIERFDGSDVVFVDGRRAAFDVVVLATGYHAALEGFLDGAERLVDGKGHPTAFGEEHPDAPGLYFVGYRNPPTGAIHDIAKEAVRVAKAIAHAATTATTTTATATSTAKSSTTSSGTTSGATRSAADPADSGEKKGART